MSINYNNNKSRREFLRKGSIATLGLFAAGAGAWSKFSSIKNMVGSGFAGVQIGVITYSYRSMPANSDQLLQYIVDSGISAIELMGDPTEEYAGKPANPVKFPPFVPGQKRPELTDEQKSQLKEYNKVVADWRANVSMDKFEELRKKYNKAGVSIYAYKPNALGVNNTDAEIEYALKAAKALGANSVTVELPESAEQSKRLGDLAAKHKVYIGYHAHTQATDTAWDLALSQSPYNSLNLDCGHYIAAGGNNTKATLLALIDAKHDRISSMHLKDRKSKENGGANMPWGEGDTPIKEILTLLKQKNYAIPVSIELEYDIPAGSDAVKETKKCVEYAKKALGDNA
jgi:sugar phosphate isomerase/epimerase